MGKIVENEDPYYHIGIHAWHRGGGGSGKGYTSMDESSASSYYQEMLDSSSVIRAEMVLHRYVDDECTDSVAIKEWKEDDQG